MDINELRKEIDGLIFKVEEGQKAGLMAGDETRAFDNVRIKLQEAKMWSGKILESHNCLLPKEFRDHCEDREKNIHE